MRAAKQILLGLLILVSSTLANKAPDFTAERMSGGKFTLSEELQKGPVLLDFWATWCKPCKKALPEIDQLCRTYADSGLQVITISIDSPKGQKKIKPFIKSSGYEFDVLFDPNSEVRRLFGGKDIPLTVLIDPQGEIIYQHLGYKSGDHGKLEEVINSLLKQIQLPESEVSPEPNEEQNQ